ncbi:hypothetical protein [Candidatus Amarobacter glycogenicus]|uniref:hypothetical protein n=1 Tax=Candidatus Amarobacter glycogenicus TaxID=3140699 RepID=UPI002A137488|nr:hypothetical protein [Dehalococcoidia bacterium]
MARIARALECDIHLVPFHDERGCGYCLRFLREAPDARDLSTSARMEELERWLLANRSVPEELFYSRIEALVGRRISPHELDDPDLLIQRAQRPGRTYDWDDW